MDIVYYPSETIFLKLAKQAGCSYIYGKEMFNWQAILQEKSWFSLSLIQIQELLNIYH
jgi:shikimate 5-dehydrogenase